MIKEILNIPDMKIKILDPDQAKSLVPGFDYSIRPYVLRRRRNFYFVMPENFTMTTILPRHDLTTTAIYPTYPKYDDLTINRFHHLIVYDPKIKESNPEVYRGYCLTLTSATDWQFMITWLSNLNPKNTMMLSPKIECDEPTALHEFERSIIRKITAKMNI